MKTLLALTLVTCLFTGCATVAPVAAVHGPTNPAPGSDPVRNYCSMIELRPEKEAEYRKLHANVWPEVQAAIRRAHIRNFNIYAVTLNGRRYLVSHFEYTGNNPARDFAKMGEDATTREKWWPITDACQKVLEGTPKGQQWMSLEQVMHLD